MKSGVLTNVLRLSFLLLFLIATSCSKESKNLKPANKVNNADQPQLKSSVNTALFSEVGETYVLSHEHVANTANFATMNNQDLYNNVSQYMVSELGGVNLLTYQNAVNNVHHLVPEGIDSKAEFVNLNFDYFNRYMIESTEYSDHFLNHFETLIENYERYSNEEDFRSEVNNLRNVIKENENLTEENRQVLLAVCSLANHSLAYWNDVSANPSHPWHDLLVADLETQDQIQGFVLKTSLVSTVEFSKVYNNLEGAGSIEDQITSGNVQAAFSIGPFIVDDSEIAY